MTSLPPPPADWASKPDAVLLRDFSPSYRARSYMAPAVPQYTETVTTVTPVGVNTSGWGVDRARRDAVRMDKESRNVKEKYVPAFNAGPGVSKTRSQGMGYSKNIMVEPRADVRSRKDTFAYESSFQTSHKAVGNERTRGANTFAYTLPWAESGSTANRPFRPSPNDDDSAVPKPVVPVLYKKESVPLACLPSGPVSASSWRSPPLASPEPDSRSFNSGRQYGETRFRPVDMHKNPSIIHPTKARDLKVKYPVEHGYYVDPDYTKKSSSLAKAKKWSGTEDARALGATTAAAAGSTLTEESVSGYEDNFSHSAQLSNETYMKSMLDAEPWNVTSHHNFPSTLPINGGKPEKGVTGIRIPGVVSGYEQGTIVSPSAPLPRPAPRTSPMFVANRAPPMSQGILDHARVDRSIVRNNVGEARLLKHMKAHPYLYETRPGQNLPPYAGPIKRLC
ncbi:hypothetical protein NFJ02_06g125140 [Pycnococcus provasolii]